MPAPAFDTAAFLTAVRRDSFLAASDDNWTDERILAIAHNRIVMDMTPVMKTCKQAWFQHDDQRALVADLDSYELPQDAMWNGVDSVSLLDTDGVMVSKLNIVDPSNRIMYEQRGGGTPGWFFLNQAEVVVLPTPSTSTAAQYSLNISSYRRPAQMILTTQACTVQSVTSASLTITTSAHPAYMTTNGPDVYTPGIPYRVDVYGRNPPYRRKLVNLTCSASSTTDFLFNGSVTAAQVATIVSGDIVCVTGTTIFPDIPPDAMPYLQDITCATILRAQSDASGLRMFIDTQMKELATVLRAMSNRADGSPKKLSLSNSAAASHIAMLRGGWPSG